LVRDRWPNAVARLGQDTKEFGDMTFHELVPSSFEELCRWAYVHLRTRGQDTGRGLIFLYQPLDPSIPPSMSVNGTEVIVRFQGFLGQCNLKALGNWKGRVFNSLLAVQYVELKAGPFVDQMAAQIGCVENIRKCVFRALLTTDDAAAAERSSEVSEVGISFQRRVFTKVQSGPDAPHSVLTMMDDPNGQASLVSRFWRVTEKIELGRKLLTGRVERCSPLVFGYGDFVDVAARIEIAN
ncbi:hypothetical protein BV25DRAFT_1785538, partial [Artomyces pyxidatus]